MVDYAVYSYVVPIISVVFFPSENRAAGILSTFAVLAVLAVSLVVRPFGGFVFGPLGDRWAGSACWP